VGQFIDIPIGVIEIQNINKHNYPDKIKVHFNKPLTDEGLVFYTFRNGHYEQVKLPEIGKSTIFD